MWGRNNIFVKDAASFASALTSTILYHSEEIGCNRISEVNADCVYVLNEISQWSFL